MKKYPRLPRGWDIWDALMHAVFIGSIIAVEIYSSEKGRQLPVLILYCIVTMRGREKPSA